MVMTYDASSRRQRFDHTGSAGGFAVTATELALGVLAEHVQVTRLEQDGGVRRSHADVHNP